MRLRKLIIQLFILLIFPQWALEKCHWAEHWPADTCVWVDVFGLRAQAQIRNTHIHIFLEFLRLKKKTHINLTNVKSFFHLDYIIPAKQMRINIVSQWRRFMTLFVAISVWLWWCYGHWNTLICASKSNSFDLSFQSTMLYEQVISSLFTLRFTQ